MKPLAKCITQTLFHTLVTGLQEALYKTKIDDVPRSIFPIDVALDLPKYPKYLKVCIGSGWC